MLTVNRAAYLGKRGWTVTSEDHNLWLAYFTQYKRTKHALQRRNWIQRCTTWRLRKVVFFPRRLAGKGVSVDTKCCWTGTSRSVLVGLRVYCRIGSVTLVLAYLSCIRVFHSVEVPCSCVSTWECARSRSLTFHHLAFDWLLWSTLYHLTSDWLCWSLVWSIWCTSTPAAIQSFIDFFLRVARSSKSSSPSEGLETQPIYI